MRTQLLHPRMKDMIITTKLKILLSLLKIKHLCYQIQIQLKYTKKNPLQIHASSSSEIFTEQSQNLSLEIKQGISEEFSLEQTQSEKERLKLQHQERIDAANQFLRKQKLERNQLLQQLKQPDILVQDDYISLQNTQMVPSTSKNHHYNKLLDLSFQYLVHSFFMF